MKHRWFAGAAAAVLGIAGAVGPVVSPTTPVLTGETTVHTGGPWAGPLPIALLTTSLLAGLGLVARRHLLALGHLACRCAGRM